MITPSGLKSAPKNPRICACHGEEPRPYVLVCGWLEARILRAPFYELVEWSETREGRLGVWSGSEWFDIGAIGNAHET
jgi:uncharacterized protein